MWTRSTTSALRQRFLVLSVLVIAVGSGLNGVEQPLPAQAAPPAPARRDIASALDPRILYLDPAVAAELQATPEPPEGVQGATCTSPVEFDNQWAQGYRLVCQNNLYVLLVDLTNPAVRVEIAARTRGVQAVSAFADGNTVAIINADYQYSCSSTEPCTQGLTIVNGSSPSTYTGSHLCSDARVRRTIGFSQDGRARVDWWYRFVPDSTAHSLCANAPGGGGAESNGYNVVGGGPQFTFDGTFHWDCQYGTNASTHDCLVSGGDVGINGEHFGGGSWWNTYQSAVAISSDGTVLALAESNLSLHTMQSVHDILYQRFSAYGKTLGNAFRFDGGSKAGFYYYNSTYNSTPTVTVPSVIRIQRTNSTCYALTTAVSPGNGGSVSVTTPSNCAQGRYLPGTSVQVQANPASGFSFSNWSGAANGSSNPVTVALNANSSITANFSSPLPTPSLTAQTTSSSAIALNWNDNATNESGYRIERSANGSSGWGEIATVGANATSYSNTGLSPSTTYYYRVQAYRTSDGATSSYSNVASATTSANPLSAPSALTASAGSTSSIGLAWSDTSSDESGFRVERSATGSAPWVQITSVSAGTTSVTDTGLSANTRYYYRVFAFRTSDGATSGYSNVADAITPAASLNAPSNLAVTLTGATTVQLVWTDNSTDESSFRLERSASGAGTWTQIATPTAASYTDTSVTPGASYDYRVRAYRASDGTSSAFSNVASITVPAGCPGTITGWRGEYWANTSLSGPITLCRDDPVLDFSWADGAPAPGLPADGFSARWTRTMDLAGGEYQFDLYHDDGARLYIDNVLVVDNWCDNCAQWEVTTQTLAAGNHVIRMEMWENIGFASATLTLTLLPRDLPGAPSGLTATAASQTSINLSWTDASTNETGFRIERSAPGTGGWIEVGTVSANITTFTDSGLSAGTLHYHRVRAYRSSDGSYSAYSNTTSTTTPGPGTVTLGITPATNNVAVGQTFALTLQVQAGSQLVDGAAAYVNFDPAVLQVVSIANGAALPVELQKQFSNTSGTLDYSAGALSAFPSGTFTLATVTFRATSASAGSALTFATQAPRASDVTYAGASVVSVRQSASVTVAAGGTVVATVSLQGHGTAPQPAWSVPLTATLTLQGAGTPAYTLAVTTDASGVFTATAITPGTYTLRVKHAHTLQAVQTVMVTAGTTPVAVGTLREGDANGDNAVTLVDFSILASSYGRSAGGAGYDDRADFNEDQAVTLLDFSLLASNYGQLGGQAFSLNDAPRALGAGTVNLRLEPGSRIVQSGDVVTLTVWVDAGTQAVDGAQASLNFDPAQLQVTSMTGNSGPLPLVLQNAYDNTAGSVDYAAGTLGTQPAGSFVLVEIVFQVVGTSGDAVVSFHHGLPRDTDVTQGGTSVLGTADAAHWSLSGDGSEHVYLPSLSRP